MTIRNPISRRDFLDGVALTVVSAALPPLAFAQTNSPLSTNQQSPIRSDYPPERTGMRGNHPGAFDDAHALARDGESPTEFHETGEEYDLVVVGGGISGLAAALFFQQARGVGQRILILDNHDDFGGHAKRNEFHTGGKMLLGVGGSTNLEYPNKYSDVAKDLLSGLGVDFKQLKRANDPDYFYAGGTRETGMFVKSQTGESALITGRWVGAFHGKADAKPLVDQLPYPRSEKDKLLKFLGGKWDYLAGRSMFERSEYLSSTSYRDFLTSRVGLAPETASLFDPVLLLNFSVGGDGLSVNEAVNSGAPGLSAVGWPWGLAERLLVDEDKMYEALLFPDGNASVARLMVRRLIPGVAEGNSMADIAAARFDYSKLDTAASPVRIRLNSTAVRVREEGETVAVSYIQNGKPVRVRAKHCVLACFNMIIPHLCPEMTDEQKDGLKYGSKAPFIWTNVLLRDGAAIRRAAAETIFCPQGYYCTVSKAPPVALADFSPPGEQTDPIVVFMVRAPIRHKIPDMTIRDHYRAGRYQLLETPFSEIETATKAQLMDLYGRYGFDAERDIEAITVNRWSHGYAYTYSELDDPDFEKGAFPHEIGRRKFGRISIANSDSEARAYLDAAIDSAWRAVTEQLA